MTNEELLHLIRTAQWFSNLGNTAPQRGIIVVNAEQWNRISQFVTQAEWNLPGAPVDLSDIPDFDWLSLESIEAQLKEEAKLQGKADSCKTARLEAFKAGQLSLRHAVEHPLLTPGPVNLQEAVRLTALQTCRIAASEVALDTPDIGCWLMLFYHQGHWPFGKASDGSILVL